MTRPVLLLVLLKEAKVAAVVEVPGHHAGSQRCVVGRAITVCAPAWTTQTAYACGWANPSGFIAAFTNIIGTTPGRYRTSRQTTARASQLPTVVKPSG